MDSNNQPLRIRAWIRSGIIADKWLPLDGALLAQSTRADLGAQAMTTPGASELAQPKGGAMAGGRLPIARVHAPDWYYRCSWAQWGPHVDGSDYWNKRFDNSLAYLVDFAGRRGRVIIAQDEYKAYHMPVYYRSCLWVEWWAVGDASEISILLAGITHLGKKSSQGWGRVSRWEIECVAQDYSIWREGCLMRGIPLYHLPRGTDMQMQIGLYGVRPSYWDRRNQIKMALPW